jgi:hypothetical protein
MNFEQEKMKRMVEQDRFLKFVYDDLKNRGHQETDALEIVFNSYILEDSSMEAEYSQVK